MAGRSESSAIPPTNPFSTRWIRPGVLPFLFPAGVDASQLVTRLRELGWWAQILGEHGSGKSSLLQTLRASLEAAGRRVELLALQAGETRLRFGPDHAPQWNEHTQVVIDGYEQLGWYARRWLRRQCRRRNAGLLVTAHRRLRLPVLWQAASTPAMAQTVVARLLPPEHRPTITPEDVQRAYTLAGGNLRETLFTLYDLFEERTRPQGTAKEQLRHLLFLRSPRP